MMTTYSLSSGTVAAASSSRDRYRRPMSSQSEHVSLQHRSLVGGAAAFDVRPPSSQGFMLDHFISHLPVLDFGNIEHEGMCGLLVANTCLTGIACTGDTQDQVGSVLKELKNSTR